MKNQAVLPRSAWLLLGFVLLAACGSPDDQTSESSASADTAQAIHTDQPAAEAAGMDAMDHAPAKDADHEFLRMMVDHHEGMIVMADTALDRLTGATAKADARKLHDVQRQERDRMIGMIKDWYSEAYMPMPMPSNTAMIDSLQRTSRGSVYDRVFYRQVVNHHTEALRMVDAYLPRAKRAEVRQMAEKMRTDQAREIADFERKGRGG
ncbi:MAG: DUF305 domain-containing protein [Gemmatimonadota bacterium]|nr:DUF305 domain-containing protein [Gemmatimonadota bacterium]